MSMGGDGGKAVSSGVGMVEEDVESMGGSRGLRAVARAWGSWWCCLVGDTGLEVDNDGFDMGERGYCLGSGSRWWLVD